MLYRTPEISPWQTVSNILTALPSTIANLTIVVYAVRFASFDGKEMEARLSRFTRLEKLAFRVCAGRNYFDSSEADDALLQIIGDALPNMRIRQILSK